MSNRVVKRWGYFVVAIVLAVSTGAPGRTQDEIPQAPTLDRDLIREMAVGSVPQNQSYSTDLWLPNPYIPNRDPKSHRAPPPGVIQDILQFRAANQHTPVDPIEEAEFIVALRKLVTQRKRQHEALSRAALGLPIEPKAAEPIPSRSQRQEQLRQSALHMDEAAARLEIAGDYAAADNARASALQLWQEARRTVD